MMCSNVGVTRLAVGVVLWGALAGAGLAAPSVILGHDDNFGSIEPHPNAAAKFDEFVGKLNSSGVDDIEDQSPTLSFGGTGVTATVSGAAALFNGGFGIGLASLIELDSLPPEFGGSPDPVDTVFNFSEPITAFGLFVTQGGDVDATPPIEPNNNNNPTTFVLRDTVNNLEESVVVQIGPDWGFYNVLFVGVLSPEFAFNQVQLLETGDFADGMLYDNVVAGFVPEPGSLGLLLLGGVFAALRGNRCRRG